MYNYIYLWTFENGSDLRKGLLGWFFVYNQVHFHYALDNLTPDKVYKGDNDDLIKSSSYQIRPAEVEEAMLQHPTVAGTAVVGNPDSQHGTIVKTFVRLFLLEVLRKQALIEL